jgi:microcystin-dependent protein
MPSHTHDVNPASVNTSSDTHTPGYDHYNDEVPANPNYATGKGDRRGNMKGYTTDSDTHTVNIPNTTSTSIGSGAAHNVLDPHIVMNFIIEY